MIYTLYITMIPVILGGILNMLFTKTAFYQKHNYPIDSNLYLKDGKPLFGKNKTWIGFVSMILFCIILQVLEGFICQIFNLNYLNYFYYINANKISFNILIGFLLGFSYMICELPNSFIKRRIGIEPGNQGNGILKWIFIIIDQIDSMIGVMMILYLFSNITIIEYVIFVFIGALTHIFVNYILYFLKIRKQL